MVPFDTVVFPEPVTPLFIILLFFKVNVPLFVIPAVFDASIYELSSINSFPEDTFATYPAFRTFVF